MRPIWTGAIGFGLVNIPVKLFSATKGSELSLDMLDKKDHANIKYKRVNEKTGKEVANEHIVRGYLYNDDYVVLDEADFEAADAKEDGVDGYSPASNHGTSAGPPSLEPSVDLS